MDASNYRRVPVGVVAPRDADDVAAALAVCRDHGVPVVPRGGGTSIAGQATGTGVVLDFTRYLNRIVSLDPETRTAVVQPGVICDSLRTAAAAHGLTFGPDPSTHSRCTIGGMIGNNSCGAHSVAWGTTADNVRALDVLTYGGEHAHLAARDTGPTGSLPDPGSALRPLPGPAPAPGGTTLPPALREGAEALVARRLALLRTGFPAGLPRRISGYALDALLPENGPDWARAFTGSEGTLGVLTGATVRLVEAPAARALAVLGYADESAAAEAAHTLLPHGPLTVEGMASDLVPAPAAASLPRGAAWLFVETGGSGPDEARARAEALCRAAADATTDSVVVTDPAHRRALWRIREDASGTATRMPDGSEAWPGWEDCAVPPARLGPYLRDFRALLSEHGLRGTPYGHFGDGCIHVRIDFDLLTGPGIARFRNFSTDLADLVVAHGGSLSGEHGDGQARAELLPRMYGDELVGAFEEFKTLWDPADGLNPGMLVRPHRLDENLRFAVLPRKPVDVAFGYPHDGGDFSAAVRRCVGVAKCRTTEVAGAAVMCPSFRATGEEQHSTRGRARLLHEMLAGADGGPGGIVTDGWRSEEVREALDLCLSCKGCRTDCPVNVDMATYKAEFLHHHYAGRLRPAAHYAMGRLPLWLRGTAPVAPVLAPVVNRLARVAPLASAAKRLGGIAPERELPELARETFRRWWRRRAEAMRVAAGTEREAEATETGTGTGTGARAGAGTGAGARAGAGTGAGAGSGAGAGAGAGAETEAGTEAGTEGGTGMRPTSAALPHPTGSGRAGTDPVSSRTVVLWPDTFTNHLSPSVGRSAVAVLEAAGLHVVVPPKTVCCGLTWVSTGQLDGARKVMRRALDAMAPALEAGLPVVGLEPSCTAALRTDLPELLPDDPRAAQLAEAVTTFAQALDQYAPDWQPPRLDRPVAGQTHCHQHAVLGDAAERKLRERAGLTGELSGGCCGLAGNFGFERGHFDVSVACAEEQLLPSVRQAAPDTELLADGFSCRTQLDQLADRRARHLAEVLAEGLGAGPEDGPEDGQPGGPPGGQPG
ncbi:FAD-binding and (Fe-S)-binding domain-containing protein [Streptomyces sp. F63]|uniref:FAD-binding and (Fe-S)-binding domain-containing protein n=1 Tax=Streptomyces sp. F63 TaxID=2824887 RepID=UPI001FFDD5B5|nr:FAD-binding and (Fe-S)-binding domain-containing protein [Streptomyces sp. F63]